MAEGFKIPLMIIKHYPQLLIGKRFFHYGDKIRQWKIDAVNDKYISGEGKNEDNYSYDQGSFSDKISSIINSIVNNKDTWILTTPIEIPIMSINEDGSIEQ